MAYSHSRKPPEPPENAPNTPSLTLVDIWDTIKAPLAGFWQGLGGKNLNYDQYIRNKARKNRRQPSSWLGRITGK